jgi:hypothetical protein
MLRTVLLFAFVATMSPVRADEQMSAAAQAKGCGSISSPDARVQCERNADSLVPIPQQDMQDDVTRIHAAVVNYAWGRGLTEAEFAERVKSSVSNIEAMAYAAEQNGSSVKQALDALSNFLAFTTTPASQSLPPDSPRDSARDLPRDLPRDFPQYDVEAACRLHAGKRSANACIETEQLSYDHLKSVWNELPDETKRSCLKSFQKQKFAYYVTVNCISGRLEQKKYQHRDREVAHFVK